MVARMTTDHAPWWTSKFGSIKAQDMVGHPEDMDVRISLRLRHQMSE